MADTSTTHRLSFIRETRAARPRAGRRGPPGNGLPERALVIVAHVLALVSVGALVIGLTLGAIAMATQRGVGVAGPGAAATASGEGGEFRGVMGAPSAGSTR